MPSTLIQRLLYFVPLFTSTSLAFSDDTSVVLRILQPRGAIMVEAEDEHEETKVVFVQIDVEAFAGPNADRLRSDSANWRICYAASNEVTPASEDHGSRGNATCVDLLSGASLPPLSLPASAGIYGVSERWKLDSWLENDQTKESMAETYARWQLRLIKPKIPIAAADQNQSSSRSSTPNFWSSLWSSSEKNRASYAPVISKNVVNVPDYQGAFRIQDGALSADLQVLSLDPDTGRIQVPPGSRIWVEVGANSRNTLASTEARCAGNEDVFVVSFEPLLGQYCRLTAAQRSDSMSRLGACAGNDASGDLEVLPNGIVLPMAVGSSDSIQEFRVSALDGCSSLLASNDEASKDDRGDTFWGRCLDTMEVRRVPTMTLHTLFDRLLPVGAVVDYLKIDTQGTALEVIESAGPEYLDHIQAVVLDTLIDGSVPLYAGQNTCSESLLAAQRWGFHVAPNGTEVLYVLLIAFVSILNPNLLLCTRYQVCEVPKIALFSFLDLCMSVCFCVIKF